MGRLAVLSLVASSLFSASLVAADLAAEFEQPPVEARPRVWWHWMDGNISLDGLHADLAWMHRIGIGGVQVFDADFGGPLVVRSRVDFMTPPWNSAFSRAAAEAKSLGLELGIASSPGFSETGGPWVQPGDAMKKVVWSELTVEGGRPVEVIVPRPPSVVGPFQDVQAAWGFAEYDWPPPRKPVEPLYSDIAVLAFRVPDSERSMAELHPVVTSSVGALSTDGIFGASFQSPVHLPFQAHDQPPWILLDLGSTRTIKGLSVGLKGSWDGISPRYIGVILEASEDGSHYVRVATAYDTAEDSRRGRAPLEQTVAFPAVSARYFRLTFPAPPPSALDPALAGFATPAATERVVTKLVLHPAEPINRFEEKAGYFLGNGQVDEHPTPTAPGSDVIDPKGTVDLTSKVQTDGRLHWAAPPGRWTILRVGYSLLGVTNHPAEPGATGLEVDKLDADAVRRYIDTYLAQYQAILGKGALGRIGVRTLVCDSYEAGPQNWTPRMPDEFLRRRGYDLRPWLPTLAGHIVKSAEASDRFLWDFRRTLGELIAENHYGVLAAALHKRSMRLYAESHESERAFIGDGMDVKRFTDAPMGAMWVSGHPFLSQAVGDADLRESASVAHLYGKNLVAAESMTTLGVPGNAFTATPESLTQIADREMIDGVNQFFIHTSVHQPRSDLAPGLTLGPFGQWFTRQETWAEMAGPWVQYLARCSYLLQQGHFVADILYFYGEDSNVAALYGKGLPPVPPGYAFDFVNAVGLQQLKMKDRTLTTDGGAAYRILALDKRTRWMSLGVLKGIADLIAAGATVVGDKPLGTPSLADDDAAFRRLSDEIWGTGSQIAHRYGRGSIWPYSALSALPGDSSVAPDVASADGATAPQGWFVHRHLSGAEIYFLVNPSESVWKEASFRITGFTPELWHADTGVQETAAYRIDGGRSKVALHLDPHRSVFVVFRGRGSAGRADGEPSVQKVLAAISGPWTVSFPPGRGAPATITLETLQPLNESTIPGVRYFSGTADYRTSFDIAPQWIQRGASLLLSLGNVGSVARVTVNGEPAGILWRAPFLADITRLVHPGSNQLRVEVADVWANRLIGDKQANAERIGYTQFNPYRPDSVLIESGLVGPVRLELLKP